MFRKINNKSLMPLFTISILILVTIAIVAYCQYPCLKEKLVHHPDINQYYFPIYHLLNTEILKNDFFVNYMLFQTPKGYIFFFYFLGHFMDLVFLAKILPFVLAIMSVIYFFLFGKLIKGNLEGFIMSFLFIFYSWTFHTFHGSTPRSFAYPLFIPLLYYLLKNNYRTCFFLYVLQIFFYPPIALICAVTIFLVSINIKNKHKIDRNSIFFTLGLFISFPVLFFLQYGFANKLYGPVMSFKDMRAMPEFGASGEESFFFNNLMQFLKSPRAGINLNESFIFLLLLLLILTVIMKIKGRRLSVPKIVLALFWASLFLYLCSYLLLFHLYYPARYIILSFPFICCVLIGLMMGDILRSLKSKRIRSAIFIVFILLTSLFYMPRISGRFADYRELKDVLAYIAKLPKDSTIAASPLIADPIPTFSKKKVLFSNALLFPFQKSYYKKVQERVYDFYDAYYSNSMDTVRNFFAKYSVDYMVIDRWHFTKEYFKQIKNSTEIKPPFRSYFFSLEKDPKDYVLPKIDKAHILFEKNGFVVIKRIN